MGVFKLQAAESNDEVDIHTVKTPKTKSTVFQIVCIYVACGAAYWMTDSLTEVA